MWRDLSHQWQIVFEEAWKAFGFGSTPIGAALFDREGQLIDTKLLRVKTLGARSFRKSP